MRLELLVTVTASLLIAGDAKEDAAKKDLAKLQGRWVMVSCERDGTKMPAEELKTYSRTVDGNKYTVTVKGEDGVREIKGTITLDPTKQPKTIDAVRTEGGSKDQAMLGIYEIDGDKQKVCFAPVGMERPTGFVSKAGTGHVLTVWKRVDPAPAKEAADPTKKGDEALRGVWRVISVVRDDRAEEDDTWIIQKYRILFKRDNIIYEEAALETDSTKAPKAIDLTFEAGPAKGKPIPGIYSLDENELKICYVSPSLPDAEKKTRPTEFSSKTGSGTLLIVLKRASYRI